MLFGDRLCSLLSLGDRSFGDWPSLFLLFRRPVSPFRALRDRLLGDRSSPFLGDWSFPLLVLGLRADDASEDLNRLLLLPLNNHQEFDRPRLLLLNSSSSRIKEAISSSNCSCYNLMRISWSLTSDNFLFQTFASSRHFSSRISLTSERMDTAKRGDLASL